MSFKYFNDSDACHEYIAHEVVETLQEDYRKMCHDERQHYTNEDRRDMRNKIHDVKLFFGM